MNAPGAKVIRINWKTSLLWLLVAATCFNLAYQWISFPAAGLLLFGYAWALIRLTDQTTVRRAFWLGWAAGFFSYAPQLFFLWNIFHQAAVVLWLVLAFWIGLFAAIICGVRRRWGKSVFVWLVPVVWTGIEYFRSELYYLRFSWLNVGYALPLCPGFSRLGMYGKGFLLFALASVCAGRGSFNARLAGAATALLSLGVVGLFLETRPTLESEHVAPPVVITGIQLEFVNEYVVLKSLDHALKKFPDSQIFVLSEYTLEGGVTDKLRTWCRDHGQFLVVGGRELLPHDQYYNTAFIVGTNGETVFQQAKSVPIQFFKDGLPAPRRSVWNSPWGKVGVCICYDLSYTRTTDALIRQGAQLLIVPTMDVAEWGLHQHDLHARVAPVRAAEYGVPIFRLASSGISQAVNPSGGGVGARAISGSGRHFIRRALPCFARCSARRPVARAALRGHHRWRPGGFALVEFSGRIREKEGEGSRRRCPYPGSVPLIWKNPWLILTPPPQPENSPGSTLPLPAKFAVFLANGQIVDAGVPEPHVAEFIKLPVLVPIRAEPLARVIVIFILETDGNAIATEGPQFFSQAVIQLPVPFAPEKFHHLRPAVHELGTVAPVGVFSVGERDPLRVATVPRVLGRLDFLARSFFSKWR